MGNAALVAEDGDEFAEFDGVDTLGYRVLGVQPNSPASEAGLVSFFDFIVGANGVMLLGSGEGLEEGDEYDDVDFPALLQENKGKVMELLVWNIKAQEKRLVELTPRDDWDGAGLLGVTIKLDNYGGADERLVRVLDVQDGSPAAVAGLEKDRDFMLGTTTQNFSSSTILAAVLEEHTDQLVEIYVYNSDTDIVRVVALMPTLTWGGAGLLGAEVGTGYLHRLPNSCRSTIGTSVERKVRWTNENSDGTHTRNAGLVEMEPHLEMEVEKDTHASRTRQPHELGRCETHDCYSNRDDFHYRYANGEQTQRVTEVMGSMMDHEERVKPDSAERRFNEHDLVEVEAAAVFSLPPRDARLQTECQTPPQPGSTFPEN